MKRSLLLSATLLGLDQATKALAQHWMAGRVWLVADGWGLTYVTNRGLWIWPGIPSATLSAIYLALAGVFVLVLLGRRWYTRWYRPSGIVDLAVGFIALAVFGNLIDRVAVGAVRDWAITPIATGNFADIGGEIAAVLLLLELAAYPPARRLLALDQRRWRPTRP